METYYADIAPRLVNYLVATGSDAALAGDLVQETFLKLWKMRDELVDDAAQVSGLAFTMAKNLRLDGLRKRSREVLAGDYRDAEGGDAIAETVAAPERAHTSSDDRAFLRARLREAFAQLPPLLREAYALFQVGGLPIREIARRTNASETLVKVRIFRAKEKLRPLLADLM